MAALREAMAELDDGEMTLIEGGARGADSLAHEIAHELGWRVETFPADWAGHGKSAGPIRNQKMLAEGRPDMVLAAPGGRGTADMVSRSERAGVPVVRLTASHSAGSEGR